MLIDPIAKIFGLHNTKRISVMMIRPRIKIGLKERRENGGELHVTVGRYMHRREAREWVGFAALQWCKLSHSNHILHHVW